jgi:hypothetical protein
MVVGKFLEMDLDHNDSLAILHQQSNEGNRTNGFEACAGYMARKEKNEPADGSSSRPDTTPSGDTGARPVSESKLEANPFPFPTAMFVRL